MAQLLCRQYGGQVADHQRELEWLMCRNPAGTGEASLAFLPDGSLVAMMLNMTLPMVFQGERLSARMTIAVVTRADQRRGFLYWRQAKRVCTESFERGARVIMAFPNATSAVLSPRVGYNCIGVVNSANLPLFFLSWLSNKLALPSSLRVPWLDELVSHALVKAIGVIRYTRLESLEDVQFEPEIDPDRLSIYADADWLNWRYLRAPRKYAVLAVGDPKHPNALAIVRTASNMSADGREVLYGSLMDVIRASGAPAETAIEVALSAIAWLREKRCHSVKSLFIRGTPYGRLLSKLGFWTQRPAKAQTKLFMRRDPNLRLPRCINGYAVTYSWADWV
jgi:hypothetical protein